MSCVCKQKTGYQMYVRYIVGLLMWTVGTHGCLKTHHLDYIKKEKKMYTLLTNLLFYITFTMFLYIGQEYFCKSVSLQMSSLEIREVFSLENTPKWHTGPNTNSFSACKLVSRKNGDHEWLIMINAFILCDLFENFWKIMRQTAKEA